MSELKEYLKRKIKRCRIRSGSIREAHGDRPTDRFNYYGGHELGYWQGRLSAFEDILDMLEELEEEKR